MNVNVLANGIHQGNMHWDADWELLSDNNGNQNDFQALK